MAQKKPPKSPPKTEVSIVRSSAAEYLTFVAASGQGASRLSSWMALSGLPRR